MSNYGYSNKVVLLPPVEPALAAGVGVMDQAGQLGDALAVP